LFFALIPDPQTRAGIAKFQSELMPAARPVPVRNIHMTLVFLGNVRTERIPDLQTVASGLDFPGIELVLDRVGRFRRTAIGWLGCSLVPDALVRFQAALAHRLQTAAFGIGKGDWTPHITLYRDLRKPFEIMEFEALKWKPRNFSLMHSKHDRTGLNYHHVGHWPA
jgi:2'-5' RNA ligase